MGFMVWGIFLFASSSSAAEHLTPSSYEKVLSCSFKIENESHNFDLFRKGLNGTELMISMRNSLYPSLIEKAVSTREAVLGPLDFKFNVGNLGDGKWQSALTVHLDKMIKNKNGRTRTGKIVVNNLLDNRTREANDVICTQI